MLSKDLHSGSSNLKFLEFISASIPDALLSMPINGINVLASQVTYMPAEVTE